uniref:Uncharacterized protein n=1 Tax=Rhizophora mucronata TaxID=61149 RepID=A0A2P2N687_RHIMU
MSISVAISSLQKIILPTIFFSRFFKFIFCQTHCQNLTKLAMLALRIAARNFAIIFPVNLVCMFSVVLFLILGTD